MKSYKDIKPLYDKIFNNINGYEISLLERENKKDNNKIFKDILYGEVSLELLYAMYILSSLNEYISSKKIVNFIHVNIPNIDFSDADLILFCCPTKDEKIRNKIEQKFNKLKNGTIILLLIHKFKNNSNFKLLNAKLVRAVWGKTPLFIYIKK